VSERLLTIPAVPALSVGRRGAVLAWPDGEIEFLSHGETVRRLDKAPPPLLCHRLAAAARLGCQPFNSFDLLELFAFVRPASFVLPTAKGLAELLGLNSPRDETDEALLMPEAAGILLRALTKLSGKELAEARGVAWPMARDHWIWTEPVMAALGLSGETPHRASAVAGLRVWEKLPEWSDFAPEPPPGNLPVEPSEARNRLSLLLGRHAEDRPQQADYASAAAAAFAPRAAPGVPEMVVAEAGTGIGKTLGYIAPASLWAEKNKGAVWLSTYTRNLQRQLDGELNRLYPDPIEKARKAVVRKGRENYLCLLNMEEAVQQLASRPGDAVALGLMARWARASRDGDMVGGDLPGWLPDLIGRGKVLRLADRRGECIHSACPQQEKCFVERSIRRARRAETVVANHALVMIQAALGRLEDGGAPTRYVFDEGHHIFDAADNAFSLHLTGVEAGELRRWLLGAEESGRSRARGLKRRMEDMADGRQALADALEEANAAARVLPAPGWRERVIQGMPHGLSENFLALLRQQVLARAAESGPYSLETELTPPIEFLPEAARALNAGLADLARPLAKLVRELAKILDDEAATLDASTRGRIDGMIRSLERRGILTLSAWRSMLSAFDEGTPVEFVDWLGLERLEGRELDIGFHRHWIDPTEPFAHEVLLASHGALITSATLRDGSGDVEADWQAALKRTGLIHLPKPPVRASMPSPFDYHARTRVFIVTDVRKDDPGQVAAAYRELFLAAGGGALGLFTAVSRLRMVHERIAAPLDEAGLPLLAQHVDGLDPATLVDIFRAEEDACLLGTDALRDGVDVPGRSLRLLVFDRVPWARPDILHKARRAAFGGKPYDDMIARLRLKQAFGRLIRRGDDLGVFVLLDPMMPSRLFGAFPEGVIPRRIGLAEAVAETRGFLGG
jgi:ATP-dependent DNA helicase DinG